MKIPVIINNCNLVTWPRAMVERIRRYNDVGEIIIRDRGVNAILGDDGDSMRYCIPPILSNLSGSFDLTPLKDRMVFFMPYTDDGKNTHFITMIKGT